MVYGTLTFETHDYTHICKRNEQAIILYVLPIHYLLQLSLPTLIAIYKGEKIRTLAFIIIAASRHQNTYEYVADTRPILGTYLGVKDISITIRAARETRALFRIVR